MFYGLDWIATVPPTVQAGRPAFRPRAGAARVRLGVHRPPARRRGRRVRRRPHPRHARRPTCRRSSPRAPRASWRRSRRWRSDARAPRRWSPPLREELAGAAARRGVHRRADRGPEFLTLQIAVERQWPLSQFIRTGELVVQPVSGGRTNPTSRRRAHRGSPARDRARHAHGPQPHRRARARLRGGRCPGHRVP